MSKEKSKNAGQGLTPIELGIALAVLVAVVGFLWMRFSELQRESRITKLQVIRGNVLSASLLAHATALMRKEQEDIAPCAGSVHVADNKILEKGSVCTSRGIVYLLNGFPVASEAGGEPGILAAAGFLQGEDAAISELAANGMTYFVTGSKAVFGAAGASDPKKCNFEYTQSPGARIPAVVGSLRISGC